MNVLSSCLNVPSLSRPWTTCGIQAQKAVVPQLRSKRSLNPQLRALSGPARAHRPTMRTMASEAPASTSCTCGANILLLRAQTVAQQATRPMPHIDCKWNLACLPPHLLHRFFQHTSRRLAACCTPPPSSILAP